jgi:spore maturation protein CgeB
MKVLVVSPGAAWSTADVDAGLRYGLAAHGVQVVRFRLTERIERSRSLLYGAWRKAKRLRPDIERPTAGDVFYEAGERAVTMALRHEVDAVIAVSAMFLHPDVIVMMRRAGLRVVVLFTESPYDLAGELAVAKLVTGCWTNESRALPQFRAVNPHAGFLPCAWHPEIHRAEPQEIDATVDAHDVVFVGSGWADRVAWFQSVDWTGINLGLYGHWPTVGRRHPLHRYVQHGAVDNTRTAALYRRATLGLNLYRDTAGAAADCLNPRAYELAACGVVHLSSPRAEVTARFGDLVPIVTDDGAAATATIRAWLADADRRAAVRAALPATVSDASWILRARTVIGDLQTLLRATAAA